MPSKLIKIEWTVTYEAIVRVPTEWDTAQIEEVCTLDIPCFGGAEVIGTIGDDMSEASRAAECEYDLVGDTHTHLYKMPAQGATA